MSAQNSPAARTWIAAGILLTIMAAQLVFIAHHDSQSFDEAVHLFAGYSYWKHADFGRNPEHPPLVKLVAALPIAGSTLTEPVDPNRGFKIDGFVSGRNFLYSNGGPRLLFTARLFAALLTLGLALVVFLAAREMFGTTAGLIALALIVFEPNILAHGSFVTTDVGVSLFLFLTVYLFYRYIESSTWLRLLLVGLSAGLTLAAKHSGILIFPMLLALAVAEVVRALREKHNVRRFALRYLGALVVVGVIAVLVLWAFYGFRYSARPAGAQLNPPLAGQLEQLTPAAGGALKGLAKAHALPEAYIYGLADVLQLSRYIKCYIFGTVYPHGVWFYFPAAFIIKSTLALLALIVICKYAIITRRFTRWREILFLGIPAVLYLLVAMSSSLNLGVRHILCVFVFTAVLVAGAASTLLESKPNWGCAVAALLVFHAVSSLHSLPNNIAYSNELFGGPANTHKVLADSSVDWGQQLNTVRRYLDEHKARECWFAYIAQTAVLPSDYGINCHPMPVDASLWLGQHFRVPATIDGPVLVSASILSGYQSGPNALNPYNVFNRAKPVAVIDDGVFVYEGRFELPLLSAQSHTDFAYEALIANRLGEALSEAVNAVSTDPNDAASRYCLGYMLELAGRTAEARVEYEIALELATKVEPEFQQQLAEALRHKLGR